MLLVLFWNKWWLSPLGWVLPKIPTCAYQWRKTWTGSDRRSPSCPVFCLWQRVLVDIWVKRQSPRWPGLPSHHQPSVAERLPWARHLIVPFQVVLGGFYTTLYNFRLPGDMLMSEMWAGNESWHLCCIFSSRKAKMPTSPYSPRRGHGAAVVQAYSWCSSTALELWMQGSKEEVDGAFLSCYSLSFRKIYSRIKIHVVYISLEIMMKALPKVWLYFFF